MGALSITGKGDRVTDSEREQFMIQLTRCQNRIYGYILSLVADRDQAEDLLQQTNLVLWRKSDEFTPGTNFLSWAFRIAFYEVLAYRERFGRDRHVFSPQLLELLSNEARQIDVAVDERLRALGECVNQLPPRHAEIVRLRYAEGRSVKDISQALGRTASSIKSIAHRIRKTLMGCIERRTALSDIG